MNTESEKAEQAKPLKQNTYFALENPLSGGPVARVFGVILFLLIIVNALLVFVEAEPGFPQAFYTVAFFFASISTFFFAIEYLLRLWVADLVYPHLTPGKARLRYVFSLMGIVDLLSFLPGVFAFFVPLSPQIANAARIIRLVRLIKISRYMRGLHSISKVFLKRRHEIIAAFMVLGLLTVTASVLMFALENPAQPEKFDSVFTGMYWAMTTITTTGYGDIVPITPLGRFVGFCTMFLSIGVVAIPAGIFSAGFVAEFRANSSAPGKNGAGEEQEAPGQEELPHQ